MRQLRLLRHFPLSFSKISCKKLPLSAAVFCFRRYPAVHASSLSMRLPSSALFFFSRQIRFSALYKLLSLLPVHFLFRLLRGTSVPRSRSSCSFRITRDVYETRARATQKQIESRLTRDLFAFRLSFLAKNQQNARACTFFCGKVCKCAFFFVPLCGNLRCKNSPIYLQCANA